MLFPLEPDTKSTKKKMVECEEMGTSSEYFASDSNASPDSSDSSGEKMVLAVREDKYFGSDGDLSGEGDNTSQEEKRGKCVMIRGIKSLI